MPLPTSILIALAVPVLLAFLAFLSTRPLINLYIQALLSDARVSMFEMIGMHLRRTDVRTVVYSHIRSVKAGMPIPVRDLETHALAGGRVPHVVSALIAARKAQLDLDWDRATAVDLAGRDILGAVQSAVEPWEVELPARGEPPLRAAACDGIPLNIRARIALATNLSRLVGGQTQEMLLPHISDAIIAAVSACANHAEANPEAIAAAVMEQHPDRRAACDIVAIELTIHRDNLVRAR
jgi:uncharacterized protein YqfA (UPF0365 family)